MILWKAATVLAITTALTTSVVFAQSQTPQTMPMGGRQGAAGNMPMMGMMRGMRMDGGMGMMSAGAGHVEGRIAFLKTELKITDAQMPLWNAVAEAMRANAKTVADMHSEMMGGGQTATFPERLAAREKRLAEQLDATRKLKTAADPLYAAFSEEQKKTADELITGMCGGMMMSMGRCMGMAGSRNP
jgi:LTXXQ motif family protein